MEAVMAREPGKANGQITSREVRGCVILGLNGGCDDACAEALGRKVDDLVEKGNTRLILDLSRAKYVESSGFRTILDRLSRLHEMGGQLIVTGLHGSIGRAFKLLKLEQSVPLANSVSSAIKLLAPEEAVQS